MLSRRGKESWRACSLTPRRYADLLPTASAIYAKKVAALTEALNRSDERQEAAEALRVLIEKIVLTPGQRRGKNR